MTEVLRCPECDSTCPEPENYDRDSRFNPWRCECQCGLTCLGNTSQEAVDCWNAIIKEKIEQKEG